MKIDIDYETASFETQCGTIHEQRPGVSISILLNRTLKDEELFLEDFYSLIIKYKDSLQEIPDTISTSKL